MLTSRQFLIDKMKHRYLNVKQSKKEKWFLNKPYKCNLGINQ